MHIHKELTCFVIGEGTLPIQCASLLLERGHQIFGIISPDALISDWAKTKGIPHILPTDNLIAFLSQKPFDYLFSIVNSYLLPKEILKLPRSCAINYHDAPLPRYAGVNATSWAVMHQEKTHGVTWHVMANLVDSGDILKQLPLDIADNETAFTLNGKCYEAAIDSFAQLIDELALHQVLVRKQNLDERTYFSRSKRPTGVGVFPFTAGVFSFNRCAHEIDALVRALDFGPYPNPLALPKLAFGSEFIVVSQIEVLDEVSKELPGTVIAIEDRFLKVSTASDDIALLRMLTINGQTLSISDLVALGLQVGYQFKNVEPDIAKRIEAFDGLIAKREGFWVERLATLKPYAIPYAQAKASHSKHKRYAQVLMPVPQEVITFLKRRPACPGSDFLSAAFAVYLARIGGTYCFDIGFRNVELQRELVGLESFFASHVPCRVDVGDEQSFEEVFEAFRKLLELTKLHFTYARDTVARYPAVRLVPDLLSENIFPVIVERVERLDDRNACSGNQLTLVIPSDGTECCWVYDSEALDGDSIALMLRSFTTFLQGIVTDSAQPIGNLTMLSEQERHLILVEWNDQKVDLPKDVCIHTLFEAQVERTPDAVAVVFDLQQLTYRELNQRTNQLAHHLQALGIGPDVLVGICMERSLEMVVGLLGILKAGGAYLPLDPLHPKKRLAFILNETQASIVLTQEKFVKNLPHGAQVICLDSEWEVIAQNSQENPVNEATVDNLIYVIYTSGSTGQPKGAMIPHRGICNQLNWQQITYGLTELDKVLQTVSFTFDLSVLQIFWPLSFGAQLILARIGGHQDSAYLVKAIASLQITVINLVPSLLRVLLSEKGIENCKCLRYITCGGEALPVELIEHFKASELESVLFNCYGPTEASIEVTRFVCTQETNHSIASIGRPVANAQIYILNSNLQPVAVGESGELHIGGVGLARGYLNRPNLTAKKFIPNPFSNEPGAHLYKTGDLARYLPNGNIEFVGRIDDQVKIRGFRIELGEIEAVLSQHPAVQQTLVMPREDVLGDRRIVAYIIANQEQVPPNKSELRDFLLNNLPDYMVPAAFVFLDALPFYPSGKVDRSALPAPDISSLSSSNFVAPRNPTEEVLAGMWAQVLETKQIGIHDNFFELGGNSLLAVKLFAQIEQKFGFKLPLATLFTSSTVEALALMLNEEEKAVDNQGFAPLPSDKSIAPWSSLVAIQPNGSQPPLFCVHPLGGEILCYRDLALHLGSDQPVYGLQPQGLDGKQPLLNRIEDMAAQYIREIQTIQPNGPYYLGGYSLGGIIAYEMARQFQQQGQEVGILAMVDTGLSGSMKRSPFLKRIFIHINNFFQQGPDYLRKKLVGWSKHGKYHLREKYMHLLGMEEPLPSGDKYINIIEANLQALKEYTLSIPVYSGRITLLRTDDNSRDSQDIAVGVQSDPLLGWGNLVTGGIDLHYIPGSHYTLFNEHHVRLLAEKLKDCLEKGYTTNVAKQSQTKSIAYGSLSD